DEARPCGGRRADARGRVDIQGAARLRGASLGAVPSNLDSRLSTMGAVTCAVCGLRSEGDVSSQPLQYGWGVRRYRNGAIADWVCWDHRSVPLPPEVDPPEPEDPRVPTARTARWLTPLIPFVGGLVIAQMSKHSSDPANPPGWWIIALVTILGGALVASRMNAIARREARR